LKFARDRRRYIQWQFEAKKRYGLRVLSYAVTSNHFHLLVTDNGDRDVIPKSIQLIAGRTGQEFNKRKSRKGAYWEDRYHATAIEADKHLFQCLVYIDLHRKTYHGKMFLRRRLKSYLVSIHKWLFCPISSLCSNFNPRNTSMYSCG